MVIHKRRGVCVFFQKKEKKAKEKSKADAAILYTADTAPGVKKGQLMHKLWKQAMNNFSLSLS